MHICESRTCCLASVRRNEGWVPATMVAFLNAALKIAEIAKLGRRRSILLHHIFLVVQLAFGKQVYPSLEDGASINGFLFVTHLRICQGKRKQTITPRIISSRAVRKLKRTNVSTNALQRG